MRPWPHGRHPKLTYEDHPRFGYYVYCASTVLWSQLRTRPDGRPLMLRCRERRPSDERLRLWAEVEERLPELEAAAFAAVPDPPVRPWRGRFDRAGLTLDEVVLEDDGLVSCPRNPCNNRAVGNVHFSGTCEEARWHDRWRRWS